ncbi:MAG: hypothetical protein Q8M09_02440 [Pseudomonadota bacterium]|nr:hypothetical protein [Pseudomonadota bacterium]MDP1903101.1 hypothetical protein [Pseudomonadota bacterium]MDP2353091.1 hypothetical protein [Pseudomonadota bacterium]
MSEAIITLPRLRSLIGLKVRHQGEVCVVIEVLESPPVLVLEAQTAPAMQADLHGRPWEYGREHRIVPVLSEDGTALHDALLDLDILD